MKVAFVQFVYYEYLGLMYLSSSLKQHGHDASVFIHEGGPSDRSLIEQIVRYRPDVVGFSIMTGSEGPAVSLALQIRRRLQAYIIFGGPHPTFVPEIIEQDGVDCVCLGEAEQTLVEIVDALAKGSIPYDIPGAWFKHNNKVIRNAMRTLVSDIDSLPRPDRNLYREKYGPLCSRRAGFILGRGCPFHCSFCASLALKELYRGRGPYVRQRFVADVIDEMRDVVAAYGIKTVYIRDDTFVINKKWVMDFCEAYGREIGLPFTCHIRADSATEEIISALAKANCRTVSFGVESGNPRTRDLLLRKEITDVQIRNCAELLRKYGIRFRTFNMLGLPGETLEEAFKTVAINVRIKADYPWCALFQPMPGTELWDYCMAENLFENGTAKYQPSLFKDSSLALEDKREIVNLQKLFIYAVKFPPLQGLIRRAIRMRPNKGFELLFALAHAWMYFRNDLVSFRDLVHIGIRNISRYLPKDG